MDTAQRPSAEGTSGGSCLVPSLALAMLGQIRERGAFLQFGSSEGYLCNLHPGARVCKGPSRKWSRRKAPKVFHPRKV